MTADRLFLIVPWLEVGGADRFNIDLIRELGLRGWKTTVVTTLVSEHPWLDEVLRHTDDVTLLDRVTDAQAVPQEVAELLRSREPSVVLVTQSEAGYLLLPVIRNAAPASAVVDLCHSVAPDWKDGGYPRYSVDQGAMLDLSIVTSHSVKRWMVDRGRNPESIEVSYTNVDTDFWSPDEAERSRVRRELGVSDRTTLVLYAARLSDEKGALTAISIVDALRTTGLDVTTVIAGDGPQRREVEGLIRKRGLDDRVRLEGAVGPARVRSLMRAADLFFLPSRIEGVALTLFEAMACRLCVVASDIGGQRELVTPQTGVLVPVGADVEARFRDALRDLVSDRERRSAMGRAARDRVEGSFRMRDMGDRMDDLLRAATTSRRRHEITPELVAASSAETVRYLEGTWTTHQVPRPSRRVLVRRVYAWTQRMGWKWPARLAAAAKRRRR